MIYWQELQNVNMSKLLLKIYFNGENKEKNDDNEENIHDENNR